MANITEVIQNAINTGSVISIVYNGGSRPGQSREIIPISIDNKTLVAREPTSRRSKTFKVQKVASVSMGNIEAATNPEAPPAPPIKENIIPEFQTLEEYATYLKKILNSSDFHYLEDENSFAVAGFFKNGKLRKTPSVSIRFFDRTVETVFNPETGDFEEQERELTGRERPWRVDSVSLKEGKTFSQLHKAIEFFFQEVQANKHKV